MTGCEDSDEASGPSVVILAGIVISVIASTASNLGVNLQKYSFMVAESKGWDATTVKYTKLWRWWAGLGLVVLGAVGDFAALGLAPQTIVTPIGSFTLVANIFFAHFWLKERLTRNDIYGTILIVSGATLAAATGDHGERCFTLDDLMAMYATPQMVVYAVLVCASCLGAHRFIKHAERVLLTQGADSDAYRALTSMHALSLAALAGITGAQSVLFAKSTAEVLKTSLQGDNQFVHPMTYVIIAAMGTTIVTETHWLATMLRLFDCVGTFPQFQAFFIGTSVVGGATYFDEFANFDALQWTCFPIGVLLCLHGVITLSNRDMTRPAKLPAATQAKKRAPTPEPEPEAEVPHGRPRAASFSGTLVGIAETLTHTTDAHLRPDVAGSPRAALERKRAHTSVGDVIDTVVDLPRRMSTAFIVKSAGMPLHEEPSPFEAHHEPYAVELSPSVDLPAVGEDDAEDGEVAGATGSV